MIDLHASSNHSILSSISARLKALRIQSNLTQEELATRTGLSLSSLKRIENGANTTLNQLIRILRSLNRMDDLASLVQVESPSPVELAQQKHRDLPKRQRVRKSSKVAAVTPQGERRRPFQLASIERS